MAQSNRESNQESEEEKTLAQLLDEKSIEPDLPEGESLVDTAKPNDKTQDKIGNELENGPYIDPDDPNLSASITEVGAENRKRELGMRDEDEMLLDEMDE